MSATDFLAKPAEDNAVTWTTRVDADLRERMKGHKSMDWNGWLDRELRKACDELDAKLSEATGFDTTRETEPSVC